MSTVRRKAPTKAAARTTPRLAAVSNARSEAGESNGSGPAQTYDRSATLFRNYDQIAGFGQDNVGALLQAGSAVMRGFEDMSRSWIDLTQFSFQTSAATARAMAGARSLQEILDLQSGLSRSVLEGLLNESLRLSESSARVVNEAAAPIQARFNAVLEQMVKTEPA